MEKKNHTLDEKHGAFIKWYRSENGGTVAEALEQMEDYSVYTDEEADEATADYIKDSVWAFNTSFILGECGLDYSGEDSLKDMQKRSCEGANDFILSLIEKTCGLDSFVESAISADGRGHFLSGYDGEENEQKFKGTYYFIYRQN